jgi:hypothetical protein
MKKLDKTYLMVGGTLLPAFLGVGIVSLISKEPITPKSAKYLIAFAVLSVAGGFFSAQMIKRAEAPVEKITKVYTPITPPAPAPAPDQIVAAIAKQDVS